MASWLENREPGDLLGEVQRFARNKPGTFLLLAAGAGVLAGRLTRGLTAGAPETSGAAAPARHWLALCTQPVRQHSAPVARRSTSGDGVTQRRYRRRCSPSRS